ncbi:MAG TPA: dTDP-4-dehydrorhamnose 3,5-epimerase [Thermodesulfobacteriota bacterium]
MIFTETKIKGAFLIEIDKLEDERGSFFRIWCKEEFESHGLISQFVQFNKSCSRKAGTIRGLHYQVQPHQEVKLICCTKGAIYDVIIDIKPESHTYKHWMGVELIADNHKMLYVPSGVAHGFKTLEDNTEVFYPVSEFYSPESECGIRWDDPTFTIEWPITDSLIISDKDKDWPDFFS